MKLRRADREAIAKALGIKEKSFRSRKDIIRALQEIIQRQLPLPPARDTRVFLDTPDPIDGAIPVYSVAESPIGADVQAFVQGHRTLYVFRVAVIVMQAKRGWNVGDVAGIEVGQATYDPAEGASVWRNLISAAQIVKTAIFERAGLPPPGSKEYIAVAFHFMFLSARHLGKEKP